MRKPTPAACAVVLCGMSREAVAQGDVEGEAPGLARGDRVESEDGFT